MEKRVTRLIDANINRVLEALRVIEDINRFILSDKNITRAFKTLRHDLIGTIKKFPFSLKDRLRSRDILNDCGKKSSKNELLRENLADIYFINLQRSKESLRSLEEFAKFTNKDLSKDFKNIRYKIYGLEKRSFKKVSSLSRYRHGIL